MSFGKAVHIKVLQTKALLPTAIQTRCSPKTYNYEYIDESNRHIKFSENIYIYIYCDVPHRL